MWWGSSQLSRSCRTKAAIDPYSAVMRCEHKMYFRRIEGFRGRVERSLASKRSISQKIQVIISEYGYLWRCGRRARSPEQILHL
jgi:hypothetical protein